MPFLNLLLVKVIGVALGITCFSIALIAARRSRPTFNDAGDLVMRYSPLLQIIANIFGYGFPMIVVMVLLTKPPKGDDWIAASIFLPSASILILFAFIEIKFHRIIVNGDAIHCVRAFRKTMTYPWSDIIEVTYKSRFYPFVFHGYDGEEFFVGSWMTGMSLLIEVLKAQLDPRKYQRAMKGIEWSNYWIKEPWISGKQVSERAR
jgi:hypothetical protein